jgi:carbonic anhydrase
MVVGDLVPGPAGHGHNINIKGDAGGIRVGIVEAKLVQLHFHAKSEHHVNGHEFPIELHLVHEIDHPTTKSTLMVVGIFFHFEVKRESKDRSVGLASFFKALVFDKRASSTDPFDLHNLLPQDPLGYFGYYRYEGSLTTGNLDEKVSWVVLRQPTSVIKSDIAPLIAAATHDDLPPQDLNRRFILRNF